jgi:hypothetical protein
MLAKWWWAILPGLLVVVWLIWWALSGYPLEGQICEIANPPQNCATHNIIVYSGWRLAKFVDDWSALVTAIATIAVAGFTATLWRATDKLFKAGERQSASTEKTARAAELSAEIAQSQLNPVLWPRIAEKLIGHTERAPDGNLRTKDIERSPRIKLEFENFGGSIAILESLRFAFGPAPEAPQDSPVISPLPTNRVVQRKSEPFDSAALTLEESEMEAIKEGQLSLWLYGAVAFADVRGTQWETAFCFRYNGPENTLEPYGPHRNRCRPLGRLTSRAGEQGSPTPTTGDSSKQELRDRARKRPRLQRDRQLVLACIGPPLR